MAVSRYLLLFVVIVLLSVGVVLVGCEPEEEVVEEPEEEVVEEPEEPEYPRNLNYVNTHTASGWYIWAAQHTALANEYSDILDITLLESGGAAEAFEMGLEGMSEFFNSDGIEAARAYRGEGYDSPYENLRGIGPMVSAPNVLTVRADAGIDDFEDLDGRPINPGGMGTATEVITENVMEILGIEPDYRRMGMDDAADAFRDGDIDAFFKTAAAPDAPDALIEELQILMDLKVISLTEEQQQKVEEAGIFTYVTPAGTYEGQDEDVISKGTAYLINAFADSVTNKEAYDFASIIYEHQDLLRDAAPGPGLDDPVGLAFEVYGYPLHAGVIELLIDMGYDLDEIPDDLIPPEFEG